MKKDGFYAEIRHGTEPLWRSILGHPFVRGIGDGSLARDRFEFYLKQDYVYLIDFSRVFGLAAVKSSALSDMEFFATLMNSTLNSEMELHRRTCAAFGISREALEDTRKAMITSAYTDYLVRTCLEGDLADILAVLVPCACGYAEIGSALKANGLPDNAFYKDWIETYSSDEFVGFADMLIERLNVHAEGAPERLKERWRRLYELSARYEYLFFDMSWKMEEWS